MITHVVWDGVADGPLGAALDVVATAQRLAGAKGARLLRQRVVSVDGRAVTSGAGRPVGVDGALSVRGAATGDVWCLAGLGAATEEQVMALLLRDDIKRGVALFARAHERGVRLAASCSATFVLAASGLLDERPATTTWWLEGVFARLYPRVRLSTSRMVVDDDDVVTAGAAFAHIDLALMLVARLAGPALSHLVGRYLVLDERTSQGRFRVLEQVRGTDRLTRTLESFIIDNLRRQVTVTEMAKATASTPRTLARRVHGALGTTPLRFAQRLRVAHAAHLLASTELSVDEVAVTVGYADAAAFRRVFRRETGETPTAGRLRNKAAVAVQNNAVHNNKVRERSLTRASSRRHSLSSTSCAVRVPSCCASPIKRPSGPRT